MTDFTLGPGPLTPEFEQIKSDIGIVENGNTATHAIPAGYYVIWKGDLYVARTDISSGTALSAESNGNLTAKTQGIGEDVAEIKRKSCYDFGSLTMSAFESALESRMTSYAFGESFSFKIAFSEAVSLLVSATAYTGIATKSANGRCNAILQMSGSYNCENLFGSLTANGWSWSTAMKYKQFAMGSGTHSYAIGAMSRIRIDLLATNAKRMGTILVSGNSDGTAAYQKSDVGSDVSVSISGGNLVITTANDTPMYCTVYRGSIEEVT